MRACRVVILVAVGAMWIVSTADRVHVWQDERLIWQDALTHAPEKPRVWVNLGRQYQLHGAELLAEDAYAIAVELTQQPGRPLDERQAGRAYAEANLALLWMRRGHVYQGKRLMAAAFDRAPYDPVIGAAAAWVASQ